MKSTYEKNDVSLFPGWAGCAGMVIGLGVFFGALALWAAVGG